MSEEDYQKLTEQLMRHEGSRRDAKGWHIPYRCPAGALTIGYGHNLDANPVCGLHASSRLSEQEARDLLAEDIRMQEERLARYFPHGMTLSPVRYAVLINMAFNLGIGKLLTFRNTLADIQHGEYSAAARRMLRSRWASQVGRRAVELARQMDSGVWQ